MDFKKFADSMEHDLAEYLKESHPDVTVRQSSVEKLQGESYTALTVMEHGEMGVNINLDDLYERMNSGGSYDSVLFAAADIAESHLEDMPLWDVTAVTDYERAKHMLCVEVIGTERNVEMLANIPHKEMENLSMVYRIQLGSDGNGAATVLVTNSLLERMGVTQEQLHEDALKNAPEVRPPVMKHMAEVMAELMGMPAEELATDMAPPMYVITNSDRLHGAAAAFYPDMMEQASRELGGSFFLLPSSIHEVILLPDDGQMKTSELKLMVSDINATQVLPKEQLTDSVYHYDAETRTFELGEQYEARRDEKLADKENRGSVLKDLQARAAEMDVTPKAASHRTKAEPVL